MQLRTVGGRADPGYRPAYDCPESRVFPVTSRMNSLNKPYSPSRHDSDRELLVTSRRSSFALLFVAEH